MREGSRNEKSEQSVGNILLSSQRTTCNGPVGGAALSDPIRFCSNFVSFCLICPFVFFWLILTLSSSTSTCLPSGFRCSSMSVPMVFSSSSAPSLLFGPPILRSHGHCRYVLVPRLFFWRGLPFCDKEKASFAGNETLKSVTFVINNAYVTRFKRKRVRYG